MFQEPQVYLNRDLEGYASLDLEEQIPKQRKVDHRDPNHKLVCNEGLPSI